MTSKRWLRAGSAAAMVAVSLLGGAGPAAAEGEPALSLSSPSDGQTITTNPVRIAGTATEPAGGRVDSVHISVNFTDGDGGLVADTTIPGGGSSLPFDYRPSLAFNGTHHLHLVARGNDGVPVHSGGDTVRDLDVHVAVPPQTPSGVVAKAASGSQSAKVTWRANPEPDVAYIVQRATGNGTFEQVFGTTDTSYVDTNVTWEVTYRYNVVAIRPGGTKGGPAVTSGPSAASTMTMPRQPASGSGAGSGGGAPGGSGGTSSGGGNTSSGSTGGTTSGGAAKGPAIASRGTVDLHEFSSLLDQARKKGQSSTPTTEFDPGYKETLPYKPTSGDGDATAFDGKNPLNAPSTKARTVGVFAAGCLATAVLVHVLWIRARVREIDLPPAPPQ